MVYGQGATRQTQTIKTEEIQRAVPGVSPITIVEKLPGVNFQVADAFNGLHMSRAIASEDIAAVELAQGTGALDIASTSTARPCWRGLRGKRS